MWALASKRKRGGNVKERDREGVKFHPQLTRAPWPKCNLTDTIHPPFLCCKQSCRLSLSSWGFLHYTRTEACHYMIYFQVCLLEYCLKISWQASANKNQMFHLGPMSTSLQGYPDTWIYLLRLRLWLHVTKMMGWGIIF